uniref:Uncharacterized protein n=1 Tax=Chinchilla lanigera TaxID=34839 RepID=A0A8C2VX37_CHILA
VPAILGALYPRARPSLLLYLILAARVLHPQPLSTEDIIALVIGNLHGAQELHPELIHPVTVFGQSWKISQVSGW